MAEFGFETSGVTSSTGVRSCYDEGKRTAETLTMDYHRGAQVEVPNTNSPDHKPSDRILQFEIGLIEVVFLPQVRIARIFNTYGPRMCIDDGRVVSNFVAQVCYI